MRKRMTTDDRLALVQAIRSGRITNATLFAAEFAAERDLNATTVRSAISRLRGRMNLLVRPRRGGFMADCQWHRERQRRIVATRWRKWG